MNDSNVWHADVIVVPKEGVNDPEGEAILGGLRALGYSTVGQVTSGKLLKLTVNAPDAETAKKSIARMCDQLLANPVIEDYQILLEPLKGNE
jgi:phosphoribosylformylglycinamidine synthase subunit PurS